MAHFKHGTFIFCIEWRYQGKKRPFHAIGWMTYRALNELIIWVTLGSTPGNVTKSVSLNGPTPASFSFLFCLCQTTKQFLQKINVKKDPSSIWCWDSNPRPLKHELSPITTRPGLPPCNKKYLLSYCDCWIACLDMWCSKTDFLFRIHIVCT